MNNQPTPEIPFRLPAPRQGGRKTKYSPTLVRQILKCVEQGLPLTLACQAANIQFSTLASYRRKHPNFSLQIDEAKAKGIQKRLEAILKCAESADEGIRLRASCWFLEHVAPEYFSRNRVEITGANGSPLAAAVAIYLPQKDGLPTVEVNPAKQIGDHDRA